MPEENNAPSLRESFICLSRPGPVTIPRYAPLPVRGSVHLSRQFLEKLTDSAIIKVALREDLSEVATGSRWLAASPPRSLRSVAAGAEPEVRIHLPPATSQV